MGSARQGGIIYCAAIAIVLLGFAFPNLTTLPGSTVAPTVSFDCLTSQQALSLIETQAPGTMSPTSNASCPGDYAGYYTPGTINTSGGGGVTTTVISSSTYPASTTTFTTTTTAVTSYCGAIPYNPATQSCSSNTQTSSTHSSTTQSTTTQTAPPTTQTSTSSSTTHIATISTGTTTSSGTTAITTHVSTGSTPVSWPWSLFLNIGLDLGIVLAVTGTIVWRKE